MLLIASYHESPFIYGLIKSSLAIGGMLFGILLARVILKNIKSGKKFILAYLFFGLFLVTSAFFSNNLLIIVTLILGGGFYSLSHITTNVIEKGLIPEEHFAKISSSRYTISVGIMPLGSIFFGIFSEYIPVFWFFIAFGLCYILIAFLHFSNKRVRDFDIGEKND